MNYYLYLYYYYYYRIIITCCNLIFLRKSFQISIYKTLKIHIASIWYFGIWRNKTYILQLSLNSNISTHYILHYPRVIFHGFHILLHNIKCTIIYFNKILTRWDHLILFVLRMSSFVTCSIHTMVLVFQSF
jgi:hypothetical protein